MTQIVQRRLPAMLLVLATCGAEAACASGSRTKSAVLGYTRLFEGCSGRPAVRLSRRRIRRLTPRATAAPVARLAVTT
jgi:hypothetical protein